MATHSCPIGLLTTTGDPEATAALAAGLGLDSRQSLAK
jgi:hypothetical protein